MRTKLIVTAGLFAGSLALTACSGNGAAGEQASGPTLPPTTTSAGETTTPPSGPVLNERGNIVKALGEEGGFTPAQGSTDRFLTFAVDAVTPDVPCTGDYPQAPENGHLVRVDLRASTSASATPTDLAGISFYAANWQFIGSDGVTVSGQTLATVGAFSCLPTSEQFTTDPLAPASQYRGAVVIDAPEAHGTLVYRPAFMQGGWEWTF